jgi:hypothetical protein
MVRRTLMNSGIQMHYCLASLLSVVLLGLGCASSQWDGRAFKSDSVNFQVGPVPQGWRRVQAENCLLAFRDSARDLVISVNGRCGKDGDDVPLQALTQHLFMYFTERQIQSEARGTLDGREALRTELSAKLDGVLRRFIVIVLKKNGCVYDFILIAKPDTDDRTKSEFDLFVSGFSANTAP